MKFTKVIIALIVLLFVTCFGLYLKADDMNLYKALDPGQITTNQTVQEGLEAEVAQAKKNYEFRTRSSTPFDEETAKAQQEFEKARQALNSRIKALEHKIRPPVITAKQIYWITRLDPLKDTVHGLGFPIFLLGAGFTILAVIGYGRFYCDCNGDKDHKDFRPNMLSQIRTGKIGAWIAFIFFTLLMCSKAFIPSTKEMAMIQITPVIVNSDFVQEDLPREAKELYGLAKSYFQEKVEKK